jgi:hypothetical protein
METLSYPSKRGNHISDNTIFTPDHKDQLKLQAYYSETMIVINATLLQATNF